jgi:hypothetical protein
MAQNQWINVTIDPAASKKPDNSNHLHTISPSTAAAADATFSFDSAKITTQSLAKSVFAQILVNIAGQLPK